MLLVFQADWSHYLFFEEYSRKLMLEKCFRTMSILSLNVTRKKNRKIKVVYQDRTHTHSHAQTHTPNCMTEWETHKEHTHTHTILFKETFKSPLDAPYAETTIQYKNISHGSHRKMWRKFFKCLWFTVPAA